MYKKMLILFIGIISVFAGITSVNNNIYADSTARMIICSFKNQCDKSNMNLGEGQYSKPIDNSRFKVFKIDNQGAEELENKSLENLESILGKGIITEETGKDGIVEIRGIKEGKYYVVEIEEKSGTFVKKRNSAPILMSVNKEKDNIAYVKHNEERYSGGGSSTEYSEGNNPGEKVENKKNEPGKNNSANEERAAKGVLKKKNSDEKDLSAEELAKEKSAGRNDDKIIKTGDVKIFYILGAGIIIMSIGYRKYKTACWEIA